MLNANEAAALTIEANKQNDRVNYWVGVICDNIARCAKKGDGGTTAHLRSVLTNNNEDVLYEKICDKLTELGYRLAENSSGTLTVAWYSVD